MTDPVMVAVAAALATKAAEGLSDGARSAFAALTRLVRRRLRTEPAAESALAAAEAQPEDQARLDQLAAALAAIAARDRSFMEELRRLWHDVGDLRGLTPVTGASVVNSVTGMVGGGVVQARDVHGGISFGPSVGPTGAS